MEKTNAPTINAIANYWINQEIELPNVEQEDMFHHCWNCGEDKRSNSEKNKVRLERCHIIAKSLGGGFEPSNFVLLCSLCHREAPNTSDKNDIWHWLESNRNRYSFYGTYNLGKALDLYEKQEGESFFEHAKSIENLTLAFELELQKITTHLYFFNTSTYYYMLRSVIKKHAKNKNSNNEKNIKDAFLTIEEKTSSFIQDKTKQSIANRKVLSGKWQTGKRKDGTFCLNEDARKKGLQKRQINSLNNESYIKSRNFLIEIYSENPSISLSEAALILNNNKCLRFNLKPYTKSSVHYLLKKINNEASPICELFQNAEKRNAELSSMALAEKRKQIGEWRTGRRKNGTPVFDAETRAKGRAAIKAKAQSNHNLNAAKEAYLKLIQQNKNMTFNEIAKWLNDNGFRTAKNNLFNRYSVMRLAQLTLFNTCC